MSRKIDCTTCADRITDPIEHPCMSCNKDYCNWTPAKAEPVTDRNGLDHSGEVNEMISNVHEAMEGRYELTGEDLHTIHFLLCQCTNHIPDIGKNVDHFTEPGKMTDNKVMLQQAYAWITMHYPGQEVLTLLPEVIASYMANFAQEQLQAQISHIKERYKPSKTTEICSHPKEECVDYHDMSILCKKCYNVIAQANSVFEFQLFKNIYLSKEIIKKKEEEV